MVAPIRKIVDRYRHLPRIAFADKVRFAIWKHLFRTLQQRGIVDGCGELVNARFAKQALAAPDSTFKRLIFVCGFGWSGSGAVADLLREYAPVTRIPAEFDLARVAGGLFSLEHAFETQSIFEREAAFRLFLSLVDYIYVNSVSFYDDSFLTLTREFIEKLIAYTADSETGFDNCPHLRALGTRGVRRVWGPPKGSGTSPVFFLKDMDVKTYRAHAAAYIRSVLQRVESKECLLLDQGCADSSADMDRFADYFGPFKAIYSYRDPRDVFAAARVARSRGESRGHIPGDVGDFVMWYRRALAPFKGVQHPNLMLLRFEELVLDYDQKVSEIERFLGFSKSDHVAPRTRFVPEESCAVSMGLWREDPDQDAIRFIGDQLTEYCFLRDYIQPPRAISTRTGVRA
jgi:hypothetical protein